MNVRTQTAFLPLSAIGPGHALDAVLWPALKPFLKSYPDIKVEIIADDSLTDIVGERFDAGVRLGEQVAKDMVAVRIGPDIRLVVAGSPDYLAKNGIPATPQALQRHRCINMRLLTLGGIYAWEFAKDGQEIKVRVDGQVTFNSLRQRIDAASEGLGLTFVPEDAIRVEMANGRLVTVLDEWCPPLSGYYLYYPNRKQHTTAFSLLLETLRYPPPPANI